MRTVWWRLSCGFGCEWRFVQLQLTPLSAFAPTEDTHCLTESHLNRYYTVIPLMKLKCAVNLGLFHTKVSFMRLKRDGDLGSCIS